jgi:hypothetical protein
VASHVPQAIIDFTGTIVGFNEAFEQILRCFSETDDGVKPLSVFGLVQMDHLAKLFKSFSEALRLSQGTGQNIGRLNSPALIFENERNIQNVEEDPRCQPWCHTFPCKQLLPRRNIGEESRSEGVLAAEPLSVQELRPRSSGMNMSALNFTLTLLDDVHISGTCFHGVFTEHVITDDQSV